jgi:hypothetical protein
MLLLIVTTGQAQLGGFVLIAIVVVLVWSFGIVRGGGKSFLTWVLGSRKTPGSKPKSDSAD